MEEFKYNLFLDDIREPEQVNWVKLPRVEWKIVRNYEDFVKRITDWGLPENIAFDHDLSQKAVEMYLKGDRKSFDYDKLGEKTGKHCAEWLVEYCIEKDLPLPKCFIHSHNSVGAQNIMRVLQDYHRYHLQKIEHDFVNAYN